MSQQANIAAAFARLVQAVNTVAGRVGTLSSLNTSTKTSLVAALNEVKSQIPVVGALIDDANAATGTTWSSSKIQTQINTAITALINGAPGASDTLKELADQITAIAQADAGMLSFASAQTLTTVQQQQGCANLGIGDPTWDYTTAIVAGLASGL